MTKEQFEGELIKEYQNYGTMICGQFPKTQFYSKPHLIGCWIGFYTDEDDWGIHYKDGSKKFGTKFVRRIEG